MDGLSERSLLLPSMAVRNSVQNSVMMDRMTFPCALAEAGELPIAASGRNDAGAPGWTRP